MQDDLAGLSGGKGVEIQGRSGQKEIGTVVPARASLEKGSYLL